MKSGKNTIPPAEFYDENQDSYPVGPRNTATCEDLGKQSGSCHKVVTLKVRRFTTCNVILTKQGI